MQTLFRYLWLAVLVATAEMQAMDFEELAAAVAEATDYELIEEIGQGGMGVVYKARNKHMSADEGEGEIFFAIKFLSDSLLHAEDAVKRFRREGKLSRELRSDNIVSAITSGDIAGRPYFVMEFVNGQNLEKIVPTARGSRPGGLQIDAAISSMLQAARGVAYAHSKDIIIRDIKPANLILDSEGVVKLLDLGLGRSTAEAGPMDETQDQRTSMDRIMGTAAFMAPEQAKSAADADHRSDIYSLGATLYWVVRGELMYDEDNHASMMHAHAFEDIPPLNRENGSVPAELDALYRKMVAKDPAERPQSMNEVVAELERITELRKAPLSLGQTSAFGSIGRMCSSLLGRW